MDSDQSHNLNLLFDLLIQRNKLKLLGVISKIKNTLDCMLVIFQFQIVEMMKYYSCLDIDFLIFLNQLEYFIVIYVKFRSFHIFHKIYYNAVFNGVSLYLLNNLCVRYIKNNDT